MYVPSLRRTSFRVRTITASCTVPFLIVPSGDASFTVTLIRSPRLAIAPVEPPMPIIISTRRAPELSATSSEVIICIIFDFQLPIADLQSASTSILFSQPCRRRLGIRKSAIRNVLLGCLLHDFNYAPAFLGRLWPRLNDAYAVADCRSQ